jgi:hypothetical protein
MASGRARIILIEMMLICGIGFGEGEVGEPVSEVMKPVIPGGVEKIIEKKEMPAVFYVYTEAGSRLNHYCPAGWAGDYGDMHMSQQWKEKPARGKTCIQIKYDSKRKQGEGWAGIFYQHPCNNWGNMRGGYDLTGYKTLKFLVRGEKGGEVVDKFMIGGITGQGQPGDSDNNQTDSIALTKDWKEYSIDLLSMDLSDIISGFSFFFTADANPDGLTMYLDEIRFEK